MTSTMNVACSKAHLWNYCLRAAECAVSDDQRASNAAIYVGVKYDADGATRARGNDGTARVGLRIVRRACRDTLNDQRFGGVVPHRNCLCGGRRVYILRRTKREGRRRW